MVFDVCNSCYSDNDESFKIRIPRQHLQIYDFNRMGTVSRKVSKEITQKFFHFWQPTFFAKRYHAINTVDKYPSILNNKVFYQGLKTLFSLIEQMRNSFAIEKFQALLCSR